MDGVADHADQEECFEAIMSDYRFVDFYKLPKGTRVRVPCCECGTRHTIGAEDSYYCVLCYQEQWCRWLTNHGNLTRDGEPDGHTPAMRLGQREKHNDNLAAEIKKLKELRKKYPERAAKYAKKNKRDWRMAPYQLSVDYSEYYDAMRDA